jgi:hypothetical protein
MTTTGHVVDPVHASTANRGRPQTRNAVTYTAKRGIRCAHAAASSDPTSDVPAITASSSPTAATPAPLVSAHTGSSTAVRPTSSRLVTAIIDVSARMTGSPRRKAHPSRRRRA